ncbi:MAG: AmmeMemoRadiSam system radical SAM enzyme [Oscillospiraceae bacterium]|nr:AmmeMemoRadiSam system radical SAM enzyme [Oscillospiraceae bacterium]
MVDKIPAKYWSKSKNSKESKEIVCELCPHYCKIENGSTGKCGARSNTDGELFASSYGFVTSIALDPIEKKPLYEFHSGGKIVSIGSFGCNLHCPFCQNHSISMEYENVGYDYLTPALICDIAVRSIPDGNIGVAYTYNEPLIGYEHVFDTSVLVRRTDLKNVLVTNGYINEAPFLELLPYIDAMNIDIKGGTDRTYNMVGGTLRHVKNIVELAYSSCHVEVTTLVVPGENEDEIEDIAKWLASIDPKIPYHLSRFFPRFMYKDKKTTPIETMYKARDVASRYLDKIYLGNV